MASGVTAKVLHVDLSARQTRVEEIPEVTIRKYLGGGALACHLLLRDMPAGVDPLGPDNMLVFMTSVINGLSLSGTNRYTAAAKSPLTGGYGESEAGGWWGPELRAAGFEGVTIRGRSETPVYLWIKDGQVEFRDGAQYWGKLSGEVQDGLEAELGDKRIRVLQTGIAGERGVRFAAIVNQLKHFHGRGGLGAVMGAKNLKAIVARGTKPPTAADKDKAKGQLVWFKEHYDRAKDRFHQLGSSSGVLALEASGILPTRNFRDGSFEGARAISGQTMRDTILVNRGTCYACAVACKREVEVKARRARARPRRRAVRAPRQGAGTAHARPTGKERALARLRALADGRRPHGGAARSPVRGIPSTGSPPRRARAHRAARPAHARRQEGARVLRDPEGLERLQLGRHVRLRRHATQRARAPADDRLHQRRHRLEHEPLRADEGGRAQQYAGAPLQLPRGVHPRGRRAPAADARGDRQRAAERALRRSR